MNLPPPSVTSAIKSLERALHWFSGCHAKVKQRKGKERKGKERKVEERKRKGTKGKECECEF